MEWLEIIISILSGLTVCIPLVIKLVESVKMAVREKNWNQLIELTFSYMKQAEKNFEDGATKKKWVMSMIEETASSINYNYDEEAKNKISVMIDAACSMSKEINK